MINIFAILKQLDHGNEDGGVPIPDKDFVDAADSVAPEVLQVGGIVQEQENGDIAELLDVGGKLPRVDIAKVTHGDDKIEFLLPQQLQSLTNARSSRDVGQGAQIEIMEFFKDLIGKTSILFDDEGIIDARNQKDFIDPLLHQKAVGAVFGAIFKQKVIFPLVRLHLAAINSFGVQPSTPIWILPSQDGRFHRFSFDLTFPPPGTNIALRRDATG
jgi:hypothetical protein